MMAAGDKTSKTSPKGKALPKAKVVDAPTKDKPLAEATKTDPKAEVKAEAEVKADAPTNYSRGEGQKPVSQAYKDNWDAIYGKKKKK